MSGIIGWGATDIMADLDAGTMGEALTREPGGVPVPGIALKKSF